MAELSIPELIRNAAQARGIDPDVALRIAERESSLNPTAKNKRSSAYGLFQVTDDTWKQYKGDPAKRRDLQENLRVGLDVISSNRDTFIKQFGREPNAGELYTMHFLGRTGGPKLLSADPTSPVSSVVSSKVLKANPDIRNKTVGEFIASMQQKMGSKVDTMMAKRGTTEQQAGAVPTPQAPKETIKERPVRERIVPLAQGQISQDMIASLGPNYQAALGAISLADTRDEDDDDEMSFAERYAARREEENRFIEEQQQASRPSALASLDLSYQSPFEEEQPQEPVMLARGGVVHRRDGSPKTGEVSYEGILFPYADEGKAKKALEEYTRLVENKESMQQFTPELLMRGEILRKQAMDPVSIRLARETAFESPRYQGDPYLPRAVTAKSPVTLFAGLPGAQVVDMAPLKDTTVGGFVFNQEAMEEARREGKHLSDVIFMAPPKSRRVQEILEMTPGQVAADRQMTLAHEAEHLLAKKGLVDPNKPDIEGPHPINTTFDTLVDSRTTRGAFVRNVVGVKDYLTKKYDVHLPAYFSRSRPEEFHEQVATLSAIEQVKNVDLTQDPELRKTLFKDPTTRKAYRAITGLRQTRLDARDLPPYTMQPEPGETTASQGVLDFIRGQLESTKEGLITARDRFARMFKEGAPQQQQVRPLKKADGGIVHRRNGSPMYGEMVPDSGPVTADTRRALSLPQGLSSAELMKLFKNVGREGVSNLESLARGSVAAVPGLVGDIESIFRSDKERKFATTPEVERQYLPSRLTKPTKESAGFIEAGTFIDPTVGLKVAKPVAQGTAKAALAGFKSVSPQLENIIEKSGLGLDKSYIVKPEGGNWLPSKREGEDAVDKYIGSLLNNTGIDYSIRRNKDRVNEYKESVDMHTRALARHEEEFSSSPAILANGNVFRRLIAKNQELLDEAQGMVDRSQSIANFIEKKLKPYVRNNLGTKSDQVRLNMDKWELEQQPKLIAEKQKQIDKVRADIDKAVAARGDINPLILTNSQAQLRKLRKEMEEIKARTGSFAQFGNRANMEQFVRDDIQARNLYLGDFPREQFGQLNWPSLPVAGKSTAGKAWESIVDSSMDVYTPKEAMEEYSLGFFENAEQMPPAWLTKLAEAERTGKGGKGIYSLPEYSLVDTHFNHMIDELKSSVDPLSNLPKELRRTPKEIEKMSVEDASTLVDKINGWRASNSSGLNLERANSPAVFETKTYPTIPNTDIPNEKQLRWVEIKMPDNMPKEEGRRILNDSLQYEGEIMKHCVGAYCPNVEKGTRVFSLRDIEGKPYATIEAVPDEIDPVADRQYLESVLSPDILRSFDNRDISEKELMSMLKDRMAGQEPYMIKQIKGLSNGRPEEEAMPFIDDFVTDPSMNWSAINDIQNTNLRQ